jgi:RNA polymerase sigma-70 factor (ECF subfamily)
VDRAALLERARSGDRAALEELLGQLAPQVHAVCRRLCRDPFDAQDAAQEALVAVARGLPRFEGRSELSTWVHRITTNACHDELRRRRRRPAPLAHDLDEDLAGAPPAAARDAADPAQQAVRAEARRELAAALDALPEEFRVAVVLRDVADLEYAAIAEITSVPVGTVRSRIARGRARLADLLAAPGTDAAAPTSQHPEPS